MFSRDSWLTSESKLPYGSDMKIAAAAAVAAMTSVYDYYQSVCVM